MQEFLTFKESILFDKKIDEITSISLESTFDKVDEGIEGSFLLEGSYKSNKRSDDFSYKLPFNYSNKEVLPTTIDLEVTDFTYDYSDNSLNIYVDYLVKGEKVHEEYIESIDELNRFIEENDPIVVDLKEEEVEEVEEVIEKQKEEKDDTFITYHIHTCLENDSLDSIAKNYKVLPSLIREYNDIDEVSVGMKIIIPYND